MAPNTSVSVWQATASETSYPSLMQDIAVDVAIVGGGITGLTTALLLKRAGLTVAVLEALAIGGVGSATGYTAAQIREAPDRYQDWIANFGEDDARLAAQARRAAIERIANLVREEQIDCDFKRVPGYLYTENYGDIDRLEAEAKAAQKLGVDATVTIAPLPFPTTKAILFPNQAQFHALNYLLGLAKAVEGGGSYVFEQTRVLDVSGDKPTRFYTLGGTVSAHSVVLATHTPIHDITRLQDIYVTATIKVVPFQSYVLGVKLRSASVEQSIPDSLFWDTNQPYHYISRYETPQLGEILIVGGENHKTGADINTSECYQRLEAYVRSHFEVESVPYRWSSQWFESVDGLPLIGKSLLHDNLYLATGYGGNGISEGTIAAVTITDSILERENPWIRLYDPNRFKPFAGTLKFLAQNLDISRHFVLDRFKQDAQTIAEIPSGSGKLIELDGEKIAAYRDEAGELHTLSAVCSHLACIVNWNEAQKSWDCPCHGARYSCTGQVLNGPSIKDLEIKRVTA